MIKKCAAIAAILLSARAVAYVPPGYQQFGEGKLPSVRPVHGPIRPNSASVTKQSSSGSGLVELWSQSDRVFPAKSIFWGKEWADPSFTSDKIAGIDRWFGGYTDSSYAHLLDQYVGLNGRIDYQGYILDTTSNPPDGDQSLDTLAAVAEICARIQDHQLPFRNGKLSFYPVYLTKRRPAEGACAVNATYICRDAKIPIYFSFSLIYNLDGDKVCDPHDKETGHSQGLAAIANATARAVADLRTDADFNGFYDSSGNEVDDKCAWTFNVPYVTFSNGSIWKLQGLWSNRAYWTGTGYPNANGEKGCVDGH